MENGNGDVFWNVERCTKGGREQYEFVTKMDNFPLFEFHCNIAKQLIKCESFHCKYTMLFQLPVCIYIYIRLYIRVHFDNMKFLSRLRKKLAGTNIFSDTRIRDLLKIFHLFFFLFFLSFVINSRNETSSLEIDRDGIQSRVVERMVTSRGGICWFGREIFDEPSIEWMLSRVTDTKDAAWKSQSDRESSLEDSGGLWTRSAR